LFLNYFDLFGTNKKIDLNKSITSLFILSSLLSFAKLDLSVCDNCDVETDPSQYSAYSSPGNTTYYVSYSSGNDSNDGLSEASPFKNLGKINSITFSAGDIIKFKKGDTWYGYFKINGSGEDSNLISVDSYGTGDKPIINGYGYQASIFVYNEEYIEIKNLELSNSASHLKTDGAVRLMDGSSRSGEDIRYGILILRDINGQNINNIKISSVNISDIYPTPSDSSNNHKGYGIAFDSLKNDDNTQLNYFDDIEIDDVEISLTGHYGIHVRNQMPSADSDYYHRNITIKNSNFLNTGGSGVVLVRTKDVLVEKSNFKNTGSGLDSRMWNRGSGLWTYTTNDAIIQECIFDNAYGPLDSYGAHIDWGNERVVVQYCLSLNNYGGFIEILGENIDCGYRYNISIGDGTRRPNENGNNNGGIFFLSDYAGSDDRRIGSENNFIYNNTIYIPSLNSTDNESMSPEIYFKSNNLNTYVYNNLIYIDSGASLNINTENDNSYNFFRNNLYYGTISIDESSNFQHDSSELLSTNPKLVNPGSSESDYTELANDYKLQSDSSIIGQGILINGSSDSTNFVQNNGGRDYFGNTVSDSHNPNIGAFNLWAPTSTNHNIVMSETADEWTITAQGTDLTNSIFIGHATTATTGFESATGNTAFGVGALDGIKKGDNNTAIGFNAGGAMGGADATTGQSNVFVGKNAGGAVGAGSYNTLVGAGSGGSTVSGSANLVGGTKNVLIGQNASVDLGAATNRIVIGQAAIGLDNNTATIGNGDLTDVYLGGNSDGYSASLRASSVYLAEGDQISNATSGTIVFSGNITVSSDMRLKDNIKPLGDTMIDILKLDGKSYTRDGREEIGLLAQDVQLVYPELVSEDANGMLSVNYQALSAILINGIKDQEARLQKLEMLVKILLEDK